MALPFFFQYIVVVLFIGPMHDSFHHKKNKPQNLRDWGSESAIDPINPPVYIQASNHQFYKSIKIEDNLNVSVILI